MDIYQIRFRDHITPGWGPWFEGMQLRLDDNGEVTITAALVDQAALFGLLLTIRDLGLTLLSVNLIPSEKKNNASPGLCEPKLPQAKFADTR